MSGIDAISRIRELLPRARIVMLSHHEGESFVEQSLQQGADGYLSKDSEPDELALALRAVLRGEPYVSPKVLRGLVSGARGTLVSRRDAHDEPDRVAHARASARCSSSWPSD